MRLLSTVSSLVRLPFSALKLVGRVIGRGDESVEYVVHEPNVVVPEPPEPVHVSEAPVLVAESAESGAEDGAGAELRIEEPWEGYGSMTASEIRTRLRGADAATAAAVKLYEAGHKGRSTVLLAASAPPSG